MTNNAVTAYERVDIVDDLPLVNGTLRLNVHPPGVGWFVTVEDGVLDITHSCPQFKYNNNGDMETIVWIPSSTGVQILELAYASGSGTTIYYTQYIVDVSPYQPPPYTPPHIPFGTPLVPPPPPSPPQFPPSPPSPLSAPYPSYPHVSSYDMRQLHIWGCMGTVGLIFPLSVILTHYASCMTHMFRKILHATLQIIGSTLLYAVGLPMMEMSGTGGAHSALGYALLYGAIPLMMLSRFRPIKQWHARIGRIVFVALAVQMVLGAKNHGDRIILIFAYLIFAFYLVYGVVSDVWGYPSMTRFIKRNEDGTYTIAKCERDVLPVGSGWSSYLNKTVFTRKQFFMRALSGRYGNGVWWGAGTTIGTMQRVLAREGKTLPSHPSILDATIGSWIFTNSHGNGGECWRPCIGRIVVYDTHECKVRTVDRHTYFDDNRTIDEQRRYVVLEAEIFPVDNVQCYQEAFVIDTTIDARRFFDKHTFLRAIFVDKHEALCFTWTRNGDGRHEHHRSTLLGSVLFPPGIFGVKLLPNWVTCCVLKRLWNRSISLRNANNFVGTTPPYFTGLFAYCYTNVEVFVRVTKMDAALLYHLCERLKSFLTHGRCVIRYEGSKLCLDFALRTQNYEPVFRFLISVFGSDARVSIHKGKYQVSTAPLRTLSHMSPRSAASYNLISPLPT